MSTLKEHQGVLLELLKEIDRICKKHQIPYFLVCGSALGAVKYKGFIPWDDDIDIGIFRRDYERFLYVAEEELSEGLFLQNHLTQQEYPHIYSKLRNSRTTFIEKNASKLNMNHGIYVDIFPLDGYPRKEAEQNQFEKKKRFYRFLCESICEFPRSRKEKAVVKVLRFLGIRRWIPKIAYRYSRMISRYDVQDSDLICNHGNWQGTLEYAPKWHYGEGVWAEFEGLQVKIPENYDAYLTQKYGDWRAELPEERQISHHHAEVCDVHRPYTDYTNDKNQYM